MIKRNLASFLGESATYYPVVTVTGPRQSGKTTLCTSVFSDKPYISCELLDVQDYIRDDPRGFLAAHASGAVLDEVQNVPTLLSYLQVEVDRKPTPGRFVLTGSQHFGLVQGVSQSLAGRTAIAYLLPPSIDEVRRFPVAPQSLFDTLWTGGYPRIHDTGVPASRWLADYVSMYIQRDVRQVLNVGDLQTFNRFLKLCAGRTGQILNISQLGSDAGISHNTAKSWLSVLETSFIVLRLPSWHRNVKKQVIKAPKLHFIDSGLVCHLLGISNAEQLRHHPLRGAIFESWVVSEIYKTLVHRGVTPNLYHFRDRKGLEVDIVLETGDGITLVECKSGQTIASDFFSSLNRLTAIIERGGDHPTLKSFLVYGGDEDQKRSETSVLSWDRVAELVGQLS